MADDLQLFDDVDDLASDDEATSIAPEHLQLMNQLVQKGNSAFQRGSFEEAIKEYSKANKLLPSGHFIILSNRSAAFCRLSRHLRKIPAEVSERNALFGLDPTYHAELALRDAEKVLKLKNSWLKGYFRKGAALLLLERYHEAQEVFFEGLQIEPSSSALQDALLKVDAELKKDNVHNPGDQKRKRAKVQYNDDFDCVLCLKLLYHPVTTPCGHTFCRACLLQAMDHGNKCPICRVVLLLSPKTYPVSVTLKNIIEKNFPEELAARREEMDVNTSSEGKEILPLFVMNFVMPTEKMCLNIFEPRYRLMVRRVMEGNHRMGMVGIDSETGTIADVACEVEITECQPLPDGRFYLEVEGRRRCTIIKSWEQDGYRVGEITWLKDATVEDGQSMAELQATAESTANLARTWIDEASQRDRRNGLADLLNEAPSTNDPERFSFWVATLLHLRSSDKLRLLRLTDTREVKLILKQASIYTQIVLRLHDDELMWLYAFHFLLGPGDSALHKTSFSCGAGLREDVIYSDFINSLIISQ